MQKLRERNTYTPTNVPQVCSNCDLLLNKEETLSVISLKTSLNNLDAVLTLKGENMQVYVLNHKERPIMPCKPRKARLLLKQGKAKVVKRTPFTIQWIKPTTSFTQPIVLGVDTGYEHVGLSAVSSKQELFSAEVEIRTNIVKHLADRKMYRRSRRGKKTWYRKARFLNRTSSKKKGWISPSIQHKIDSHVKLINLVTWLLPVNKIVVETASFDIQKIKNPLIEGEEYQQGVQKNFYNVREYVLYRDNHTCQHCKAKNKKLHVHHIIIRKIGGDRPDNLITLCKDCHDKYHKGLIKLSVKKKRGFKAETCMSIVKSRLIELLKDMYKQVEETYGYITKFNRIENNISKSHINDAFVIAGGSKQIRLNISYLIQQVRKCNRKLFRGARSHIKNTIGRILYGFQVFDKVLYNGIECFIFGRRVRGDFDIRKLDGTKLGSDVKYTKLSLLEKARTFIIERRMALIPFLM